MFTLCICSWSYVNGKFQDKLAKQTKDKLLNYNKLKTDYDDAVKAKNVCTIILRDVQNITIFYWTACVLLPNLLPLPNCVCKLE